MKSSPLKIILSLSAVVGFALLGAAIWLIQKYYPFKPSVERDGGTILVYELDDENLLAGYQPKEMAEAMRRRVDPTGVHYVTVRPEDDRRIEVRIPREPYHEERVEQAKEMLGMVGVLEFYILANEIDDAIAIEAARQTFASAKEEKVKKELDRLNREGKPPPPPVAPDKAGFVTEKGQFNYSWLECGRSYRYDLGFDHGAQNEKDKDGDPTSRALQWAQADKARKDNEAFQGGGRGGLYYSRAIPDDRIGMSEQERKSKIYEYFVLAREMPAGMDNPGKYVDRANETAHLEVAFSLKAQGGNLMGALTGRNVDRQMAIVLDGFVMSSANLQGKITTEGQITGHFTPEQISRLVTILREGALPAKLKPRPVSETEVDPPKRR